MRITVRGRSMHPTLADGDAVEVRLCTAEEARVGDVVLVMQGKATILHRLIAKNAASLVTQGDGVRFADDPIPHERVLGIAALPRRALFARLRAARRVLSRTLRSARRSRRATR